jgi:hypothetical protein
MATRRKSSGFSAQEEETASVETFLEEVVEEVLETVSQTEEKPKAEPEVAAPAPTPAVEPTPAPEPKKVAMPQLKPPPKRHQRNIPKFSRFK